MCFKKLQTFFENYPGKFPGLQDILVSLMFQAGLGTQSEASELFPTKRPSGTLLPPQWWQSFPYQNRNQLVAVEADLLHGQKQSSSRKVEAVSLSV